ncbi:lipopolysaccharide assembly protein LapA domain-containing protein [Neisseria sp. ZJ106]|uniref:LapA family protein n=1 Tax=Neisseria lisongii TaxID=2912188 RepID=A0ABY7RJ56_9NEIS|nr:LapA family protein [Neisseria lisongii]MCF7521175.1 lipopolysaccharide assembly protein LapA domain-containing protein [Neisseria lisongii]WCL71669.1 LapA family protein [Neisseria lisongii]
MKIVLNVIKILVLLVFLLLAVSNTQTVSLFYLPGQPLELPLIVALFAAFVIGIVFGLFALFGRLLALRSENNRLRAEVKKTAVITEQEIRAAAPVQTVQTAEQAAKE